MFETEGKKILRNKNKLANGGSAELGPGASSSVYKELKLSEMLSDELEHLKTQLQSSRETNEKQEALIHQQQKHIRHLQH